MPFDNLSSEFGRFFNYGNKEPIENYTKANVTIQNIGINRLIDVFKGHKSFGCVKLKNNYRSPLSELADLM